MIAFIALMCCAPAIECDDCFCEIIGAVSDSDNPVDEDCACSPFMACTTCSGFIASENPDIVETAIQIANKLVAFYVEGNYNVFLPSISGPPKA